MLGMVVKPILYRVIHLEYHPHALKWGWFTMTLELA